MKKQSRRRISRIALAILFITIGIYHFVNPAPFLQIMPSYLPLHAEAVFWSGVVEVAGGLALLFEKSRLIARYALIALLIAVFPANINMAVNHITLGLPEWALWIRLPFQLVLIYWVFKATRPHSASLCQSSSHGDIPPSP